MKKKLAALVMCAVLAAGSMTVSAAPRIMDDGNAFDAEYYAACNPDVVAAVGDSEEALYEHFLNFGQTEGRFPFDPATDVNALIQSEQEAAAAEAAAKAEELTKQSLKVLMGEDASDADLQAVIDSVNALTPAAPQCVVTYNFADGSTYTVVPAVAMTMMKQNKDGSYYIDPATGYYTVDQSRVKTFLSVLAKAYGINQDGGKYFIASFDGRKVKLNGSFSNKLSMDTEEEAAFLTDAIQTQAVTTREPSVMSNKSYVEVDMTNQKVYYYKDGKLVVSGDIVTGNTSLGRGTPAGVYTLKSKVRSTYLIGKGYRSYVNYWMPFIGNSIGLHDALWRSSFGGNIYKTNGSHGCVNMELDTAKTIYENITVGTPVIVFY